MSTIRTLQRVIPAVETADGAGVRLRRSIGSTRGLYLDPFLMLDEFYSDDPRDYLAGFPSHPHRGFETVTYMLDGHMRHEDHLGNRGDLGPGAVQWMTAARGIIHSEMPQQNEGRMRGFQLWINLPSAEKMKPAAWRDIPASEIAEAALPDGGQVRLIAGSLDIAGQPLNGPVQGVSTDPLYADLHLPAGARFEQAIPRGHTAFVFVYEGSLSVAGKPVPPRSAAVLGDGDLVSIEAGADGARVLLLAARPLREPIVQYGPFVMNTREQIEQALDDYRNNRLHEPQAA